jgi:hypothetical protein
MINEPVPNPAGIDRGNKTLEQHNCGDEPVGIGG